MFRSFESTCEYLQFPAEATEALSFQYGKIKCDPSSSELLSKVYEEYRDGCLSRSLYEYQISFEKICQEIDVHSFQSQMIFYICLVPLLYDKYLEKGIPESIFKDSVADLRCKLFECHRLYGIWGSFVAVWFSRFFNFTLYGIGRLEFALYNADEDIRPEIKNRLTTSGSAQETLAASKCAIPYVIKKGDALIDVHIPSRGRLPHEEVISSYKAAYDFWKNTLKIDAKGFICESWMLFPKHEEIIPEAENLMSFYRDYDIYEKGYDDGDDLWRIFYVFANKDCLELLPRKTYLQKKYAEYLENGGKSGWGKGVIPISRIINEQI